MKIVSLSIINFRTIQRFVVSELPDGVILAGPNGCGKSTVLDAIRLLKSAYGQYQDNEWQMWFNEFHINTQNLGNERYRVLNDPSQPLVIDAKLVLAESEIIFLRDHGKELAQRLAWDDISQRVGMMPGSRQMISPRMIQNQGSRITRITGDMLDKLNRDLDKSIIEARFEVSALGDFSLTNSPVLELIFSTYAPGFLGVIDYHSATRNYGREQVASINLDVTNINDRSRTSALYNTQNKYANVKSEMASAYVRELLSREAGTETARESQLIATLKDMFETFFPGKKFLGPQPTTDGKLLFQVELSSGSRHDLDELSSGEKEVLLGYLRLRNSAPKNSVILLDEPELHLNPRLIRGLPKFYQKHLGQALNNQIWMNTHSDALLRETIDDPAFAVFHMRPSEASESTLNQAHLLHLSADIDRAVVDLVGDLASYSPQSRIVLLEGGGDSEVDLNLIRQLFPKFSNRVNLVSGGSKSRTHELHTLLEQASADPRWRAKFFSIVDKDFQGSSQAETGTRFAWDVYHIENYLLNTFYIRTVIANLTNDFATPSESQIQGDLIESARDTIGSLVRIKMEQLVNSKLVACIQTRTDPSADQHAESLRKASEISMNRISAALATGLTLASLQDQEIKLRAELNSSLIDGSWTQQFRGRDILKRFVSRNSLSIKYEVFRNLIISAMRRDDHQPTGMKIIIDKILQF